MAYNHEWPYVDPNIYNDDWLLNKVKALEIKVGEFNEKLTNTIEGLPSLIQSTINKMMADGEFNDLYFRSTIANTFGGKRILILGDSLSSYGVGAPYGPNWTEHFRTEVSPYAAEIINIANGGDRWTTTLPTGAINKYMNGGYSNFDIIIIMLGINDCMGGAYTGAYGSTDISTLNGAMQLYYNYTLSNSPNARTFIITPPKCTMPGSDPSLVNVRFLSYYRTIMLANANRMGFNIIDASTDAPYVNGKIARYQPDFLHFSTEYAPIFAKYVIQNIIAGGSNKASFLGHKSDVTELLNWTDKGQIIVYGQNGLITLAGYGHVVPPPTRTAIAPLPDYLHSQYYVIATCSNNVSMSIEGDGFYWSSPDQTPRDIQFSATYVPKAFYYQGQESI